MDAALTQSQLDALHKEFAANRAYKVAQNAVAKTSLNDVVLDNAKAKSIDHTMSHHLDDWKVTNQKQSGRCWLFAGLNLLRPGTMKALGVKDFEFSQNHIMFWDKIERANYLLEQVIDMADVDIQDRTLHKVLASAAEDGGQWNMFVALVQKHGLVPKSVMPETHASSATREMNGILRTVLREGALRLRTQSETGASIEALRETKEEVLQLVHRVLCIHLGTPPASFNWQWIDSDKEFHHEGELTPQQFARKYVTLPLDEYVCLVHDPRHEYGRTYTVDRLGNVIDAPGVVYLNVDIDVIADIAAKALTGGEPVWFGCDVGPHMARDEGIWDTGLFDYEALYDTEFGLDKVQRLHYQETAMTHAMLFTGVDVRDGEALRWRVENSWGDEKGQSGYWTMTSAWFREYVFEISARRSALPAELAAGLDTEPIVLPAWDPMGSLAR
ncbi:aminopeptidase C [Phytomonospora endophytica]|uniref:Aminopeptidase n=1 Tax=Phytomonospora endophytica TaxID=714109 RepID=A0A841FMC3_9ACTN|nr:C1 family peptidase [Phytomonospora endophytica]MBB6034948.1 bleomycin hydrolase [Phytomonospora endophytica]GIG70650.1 aminopeptidase C [Phytomonospora endophytica]